MQKAFKDKTITEAFGAGTAAVVAPIETIQIEGTDFHLPRYGEGCISNRLQKQLELIRSGIDADVYEWNVVL